MDAEEVKATRPVPQKTIPFELRPTVEAALKDAGDPSRIMKITPSPGGYDNYAVRLSTGRGQYLLKWRDRPRPFQYRLEARGLALIGQSGVVRVPTVISYSDASPAYLLEEWIGHRATPEHAKRAGSRLGERIALLHQFDLIDGVKVPGYGFDVGGENGSGHFESDWVTYFRDYRLARKIERLRSNGLVPTESEKGLAKLLERLPTLIGSVERRPGLLHGDLWRGNVLTDNASEIALADPAALYGDRELELARSEVMGEMPPAFFDAYWSVYQSEPGYEERRDLYSLDFLLDLANGERQGVFNRIDALIRWYVGRV